ncbi:hypothetical protein Ngar_c18980 [Candidatus Nitrososphaera gargensis Ga9.2]|uniref:Uncharacterized protein n=2 Tax=Candidatus Nitrososphaera gargensis TaxID=497727 RepID=K0IGA9_NITGG|nr:hypothetical protein Ngar_c18980 [Candidatus Nitrososphaera gargensis Ga9.2]
MAAGGDDYPVVAGQDGIKLKTEKMVTDQLYYCIYDNKVFLFYKDEEGLLHCYEVENPDAVREIAQNPSEIESILKRYAAQSG